MSLRGSGLDSTLRLMCTVCRSLDPVGEVILLGVARMSYMMGLWSQGILKFRPGITVQGLNCYEFEMLLDFCVRDFESKACILIFDAQYQEVTNM